MPELPSRFCLGTGRTHDVNNPGHCAVVRTCLERGIWFHSSIGYGAPFNVLARVFAENRGYTPHCILKINGSSPETLIREVDDSLAALGLETIEIVQLCGNPFYDTLVPGAPLAEAMAALTAAGKVGAFWPEVFWSYSANISRAVADGLFPGYVTFYNAIEREVSNELLDLFLEKGTPLITLRTLARLGDPGGGGGYPKDPRAALIERQLDAVVNESGITDPVEFRIRFALSIPHAVTTVGGTGNPSHLSKFLDLTDAGAVLPAEVFKKVTELQQQWWAVSGIS